MWAMCLDAVFVRARRDIVVLSWTNGAKTGRCECSESKEQVGKRAMRGKSVGETSKRV